MNNYANVINCLNVNRRSNWIRSRKIRTFTLLLIARCIILLPFASAVPIADSDTERNLLTSRQSQERPPVSSSIQTCGFQGDTDTYGYGIRIGLYLQWITSSIACNSHPEEAISMRGINNVFQAATFSGLIYLTVTKGPNLYAVEAFLMLLFYLGSAFSGSLYKVETNERKIVPKYFGRLQSTTVNSFVRVCLGTAFVAYGVWFTFYGMDHMLHPPCSTYAFFLVRVNLYNWYRTFLKVIFVAAAIGHATFTIDGVKNMIVRFRRFLNGNWKNYGQGKFDEDSHFKASFYMNLGLAGGLIVFIIAAELTIKWNQIQGAYIIGSTGQLLPIIVSTLGIFRMLLRVLHRMMVFVVAWPLWRSEYFE